MHTFNFEVVNDRYTGELSLIERVVLYKDNQVVDVCEYENAGGPFDWTREEIIANMKKRNNL